jgi:RNA 2',3'-cyclic 3'-phosphodiesterase
LSFFVAVDLDDRTRGEISALIDHHAKTVEAKWLPPHKLHLTVQYLAHPTPEFLSALEPRLDAIARGRAPFALSLQGSGIFETRRAPAVLWLGVKGELAALEALHVEVAKAAGVVQEHAFVPHLTLARGRVPARLAEVAKTLEHFSTQPFSVSALTLYESRDHVFRVAYSAKFS